MKQGRRFGFSAEQKLDVWRRWKAGQTLHEIGRAVFSRLECSLAVATNMNTEYRIESVGSKFVVVDPWGENLVDSFPSEVAAKQAIAECKKEDETWETAKILVDTSIKTLMKMHKLDEETAGRLIRDAAGS